MSTILELQTLANETHQDRSPSTNSWAFCFSTTSVIVC
ncbi:class III lanthipeptide [Luteococcus sp.]